MKKISFYTKSQANKSRVQNSRVSLDVDSLHFSSASDNNLIHVSMPFFRVIEETQELDYSKFRVPIFKCKQINGNTDVRHDEIGFALVDLDKVAYKDEPFIMAEQAKQLFYVKDPCDLRWFMVLQGRTSGVSHQNDDLTLDICETPSFSTHMPSII